MVNVQVLHKSTAIITINYLNGYDTKFLVLPCVTKYFKKVVGFTW